MTNAGLGETQKIRRPRRPGLRIAIVLAAVAGLVGVGAALLLLRPPIQPSSTSRRLAGAPAGATLVNFDDFLVSVEGGGQVHLLKASVRAVVADPSVGAALEKNESLRARARARVFATLTARTLEDLRAPGGEVALRRELVREVNGALRRNAVQDVRFSGFVVQ